MSVERNFEWFTNEIPIEDPQVLQNAEESVRRSVYIGRIPRAIGTWAARIAAPLAVTAGGIAFYADSHPQQTSDILTEAFGRDGALWVEDIYFTGQDKLTKFKFQLGFGPDEKPFETPTQFVTNEPIVEEETLETKPSVIPPAGSFEIFSNEPFPEIQKPLKPKRMTLPETHILYSNPLPGEGSWSIDGLPTTAEDLLMAKTFIRPDGNRPYANTVVMVFDSRRIRLNIEGGKGNPAVGGGSGPGRVLEQDLSNLLFVMNGGFQLFHAPQWGAYMDGVESQKLRAGYASVVAYKDGTIKMGTWGDEGIEQITDDMVAVRQNTVLLLDKGEITPAARNEADTSKWGLIELNSPAFITWRSAIGMTKDGNFMVAFGSSMSPYNLAVGMKAAGAEIAMQLDINQNWIKGGVVVTHDEKGRPIIGSVMDGLSNGNDLLSRSQERDIMYLTYDDSRYKTK